MKKYWLKYIDKNIKETSNYNIYSLVIPYLAKANDSNYYVN